MKVEIEYTCDDERWDASQFDDLFKRILVHILERNDIISRRVIFLSILLADDDGVRDLNRTYRHVDKSTNILSFPCDFRERLALESCDDSEQLLRSDVVDLSRVDNWDDVSDAMFLENEIVLGSLAFAYQTIYDEACLYQKFFEEHVYHLFVHGVLHLLGYDHINEEERQTMEALEIEILHGFGFGNPYELGEICGNG